MIDTLRNIKIQLGIDISDTSQDDKLNLFMKQAQGMITSYLGYKNIEKHEIENEFHNCDGVNTTFHVECPPIDQEEDFIVKIDGVEVDASEYEIYYDTGLVIFYVPPVYSTKKLSFSYFGGWSVDVYEEISGGIALVSEGTMPQDIKMVFFNLVKNLLNGSEQDSQISSETFGDRTVTYRSKQGSNSQGTVVLSPLADYEKILNAYRRYAF